MTLRRIDVALCLVFVVVGTFYIWTAASTFPLLLHGARANPYNQLADAFLHFRLSLGRAPSGLLRLSEPYNPAQNALLQTDAYGSIHDYALYHGQLFLTWGPVPAVLLAPLRLLGFEPSESLLVALLAVAGFGFALAVLRVILTHIDRPALWMCVLAALTLGLASTVPFLLRRPMVYEEEISSGFCFAMAGTWLAISTLARRTASLARLVAISLCFGLATGSRVDLAITAIVMLPVYFSLRSSRPRGQVLAALLVPIGACLVLLMAYNTARFGSPLEIGGKYQLAGFDPQIARYGDFGYMPPDIWFYLVSPPRLTILFPFLSLAPPPVSYPLALPAHYEPSPEATGGLLPMAPILLFLVALPWLLHRRRTLAGPLTVPLLLLTGAALTILGFVSYEFFSTTERYEVDFTIPLLLVALTIWLVLSTQVGLRGRRFVRMAGALLAVWSCVTGLAVSFVGYDDLLATNHPGLWGELESIGSPLSRVAARLVGHPVLASVITPHLMQTNVNYATIGAGATSFWLNSEEQARITVVSPHQGQAALVADVGTDPELPAGGSYGLEIRGPGNARYRQRFSGDGVFRVSVPLAAGLDHLVLKPFAPRASRTPYPLLLVEHLTLSSAS